MKTTPSKLQIFVINNKEFEAAEFRKLSDAAKNSVHPKIEGNIFDRLWWYIPTDTQTLDERIKRDLYYEIWRLV